MHRCNNCGNEIDGAYRVCPRCGEPAPAAWPPAIDKDDPRALESEVDAVRGYKDGLTATVSWMVIPIFFSMFTFGLPTLIAALIGWIIANKFKQNRPEFARGIATGLSWSCLIGIGVPLGAFAICTLSMRGWHE